MTDTDALGARVDALEMRVAEHERTIEDLNATILGQWKEIEALNRHIARLGAQMREIEGDLPSEPDRPPPHY
jgi:SlyX protein